MFRIAMPEGPEYVGISPAQYCHLPNGEPVPVGIPKCGELIEGVVDARLMQNGATVAWVSLPTGENVTVPAKSIRYRRPTAPEPPYVLVGPGS